MKSMMPATSVFANDWFHDYLRAGSPDTSIEELRRLAASPLDRIRLRVAENEKTPKDILSRLSTDSNPDIRAAVALNTSTPKALKKRLAADSNPSVRYAIAEDPHTHRDLILQLCDDPNAYVSVRARRTLDHLAPPKLKVSRSFADGKGILKMIKGAMNLRQDELRFA